MYQSFERIIKRTPIELDQTRAFLNSIRIRGYGLSEGLERHLISQIQLDVEDYVRTLINQYESEFNLPAEVGKKIQEKAQV